jgi:ribosomal protein S18 acetylase RimI-like enzyme
MTCEDWRQAAAAEASALLGAEADVWRDELAWQVTEAWRPLEAARAAGTLPGFIARDDTGRAVGWTWFVRHQGWVQVGALVASTPEATGLVLDAVLQSPELQDADGLAICVRDAAPGLRDKLAVHGIAYSDYRYLVRAADLGRNSAAAPPIAGRRAWTLADISAAAALCARAYPSLDDVRAFAPGGTSGEWRDYVTGLIAGSCGRFVPEASWIVGSSPDAVIVTTDLGMGTAHIAQIAVDPQVTSRGLGSGLVQQACADAASRGFVRMTLLVSAVNRRAASI